MSLNHHLVPWEYEISDGFHLRGLHSQPSGKPVIHFIHGNGFCGLTYAQMLAPLAEHFDLFISDAQGHGDSDHGTEFLGWNRSARYASEVWAHYSSYWRAVPKIACGHSFGAVLTSVMLAKQSDLFDRAILLDPVFAPQLQANVMVLMSQFGLSKRMALSKQAAIRGTSWPNEEQLWDYFHERGVFKGWSEACLKDYLEHGMRRLDDGVIELKSSPEIESAIFASYPRGLWQKLRATQVPVSILYGEETFPFILKALPRLIKQNPQFALESMPGGHCFMQEFPELTANKLLHLLALVSTHD